MIQFLLGMYAILSLILIVWTISDNDAESPFEFLLQILGCLFWPLAMIVVLGRAFFGIRD